MKRFAINKKSWAGSAPVANNNTYTTPANTTFTRSNVLTNDTDADGETLTAMLVSSTTNGSLTLNTDGTFIYVPNAGFSGTDIFYLPGQ